MEKKRLIMGIMLVMMLAASGCSGSRDIQESKADATVNAATEASAKETGQTESPVESAGIDYPTKPITIITHSEPGGGVDLFIRAIQPYIQQELGQPIVIENVPGAAGRIGTTQVWKSEPDGYTLLSHTLPLTTVGDVVYDAEYEILEFEHLVAFDVAPYVVIVKKNSEINTFDELMEAAKTKQLSNATSGVGGAMHFQSVILKDALGIDYADIPFNGSNPSMMAVMSGDVDFSIIPFDIPLTNLDEVKVLVAFGDERLLQYPDVPCTKELGYDFTTIDTRRCIVAPKGTPKEICNKLMEAFVKAANNPDYVKWAGERGVNLDILTGDDYYKVAEEAYKVVEEYKDIVAAAN